MDRNLTLRSLCLSDLDTMVRLSNNPDVVFFLPGTIQSREGLEKWITGTSPSDHEFMIMLDDTPIGECSLSEAGDSGEIGLMLFPEYWRKGYGTETVRRLMGLAQSLKLKTVTAKTSRLNKPCIRIFEKLGFEQKAIGWMVSEEQMLPPAPLNQLFEIVAFEKNIQEGENETDICHGGEGTEETE